MASSVCSLPIAFDKFRHGNTLANGEAVSNAIMSEEDTTDITLKKTVCSTLSSFGILFSTSVLAAPGECPGEESVLPYLSMSHLMYQLAWSLHNTRKWENSIFAGFK